MSPLRHVVAFLALGAASLGAAGSNPLQLDAVTVIGSRLPRVEADGPAPVSVYDRDAIAATGALRLADFLNFLPQNYTGASSGRGSAPNDANPEFGVRTETTLSLANFTLGLADVPLGQSGVSGANLRGLGSGSTLVLVDGRRLPIAGQGNRSTDTRQGFVDLNTIPLGMIERVEVLADGASALYGSDAIGGVINVVLKKNYTGAELAMSHQGTFAGGARQRQATFSAGFTAQDARLRGTLMLDAYERDPLTAAQRDFSREQDHRGIVAGTSATSAPVFGRDFRLNWGYPAVVEARTGSLNGVTAPAGGAARVALVPDGARTTPAPAQFQATSLTSASGARRMNTAEFLDLQSPQQSRSVRGSFEYCVTPALQAHGSYSYTDVRGQFDAQPPASETLATSGFGRFATLVPATIAGQPNAMNPFGQDVLVGLTHVEFGRTRQTTRTRSHGLAGGVTGALGRWTADAGASWSRQRFAQRNVTFDPARFAAALVAVDPAQRFNPFVDARAAGPVNAALYATMASVNATDGASEATTGTFAARGPLHALPAGELQLAVGAEFADTRHRAFIRPATGASTDRRARRHSQAWFAEASVPLFARANARPPRRRLELQLATRHERHSDAGATTNPKIGVAWTPFPWLLARASHATGFRAPSLTEYQAALTATTSTLSDPRRTPTSTPGIAVRRGANPGAEPETSRHEAFGVVVTPAFAPGFSLGLDYGRIRQRNALQQLAAQAIVTNEASFPGRVTRAAPTAQDLAANQPGAIVALDATLVNFGALEHENLDVRLDYEIPGRRYGQFRVTLQGSHVLAARNALRPGAPETEVVDDTGAPPRWRGIGTVTWKRERWNAAAFVSHLGAFTSNLAGNALAPQGYPSFTTMNVHVGHTFADGLWRGRGKGARIGVGINNVFDRAPPFSDTVFGFNGGLHSPLGRGYAFSFSVPFK